MFEYRPSDTIKDPEVYRELLRLTDALKASGVFDVAGKEPVKPRDGQQALANGVTWNPLGNGLRQPVWYDAAAQIWKPLGGTGGGPLEDSVANSASYAYQAAFNSGYVAYHGPGATLAFNTNFIFGTSLPRPDSTIGPALLLGAGVPSFWIIQDTRPNFSNQKGTTLGISAGQTADTGSGNAEGGDLLLYGGGSDGGRGGLTRVQGGTSLNGDAGYAVLKGGDATNAGGLRGDAFVQGGENGLGGGNVHLIATWGAGVDGEIRFRFNSEIAWTLVKSGAVFFKTYGCGLAGQPLVSQGPGDSPKFLSDGLTGEITLAKITPGGANGLIQIYAGIVKAYVAPT